MTLREYLTKTGLTQKEAAKKLQISEATLSRLLSEKRRPSYALRYLIRDRTRNAIAMTDWVSNVREG